jgi:hypothetical protein
MLGCGATSLLYNIVHAVRHEGASTDWVNVLIAVIYGVAPVAISMLTSHMATTKRAAWEVLVMLAVMLAAMAMSITAAAELVRPVAGPYACWLFPAALDTATLMAFRMIVVPIVEATRGRSWWTRPLGVGRATPATGPANRPANRPATPKVTGQATSTSTSRASRPSKAPATAVGSGRHAEPVAGAAATKAVANPGGPGTVIDITEADGTRKRGPVEKAMRDEWDRAIADSRIPTGGDLNRAAGKPGEYSLGKKHRRRWLIELAETDPDLFARIDPDLLAQVTSGTDGTDESYPAHRRTAVSAGGSR